MTNTTNHCGAESNVEYMVRFCEPGAEEWTERYFTFASDAEKFREECARAGRPTLRTAKVYL